MPTLYCMRGLPGSGKSTEAIRLSQDTDAEIVCRDDLRWMMYHEYVLGSAEENTVTAVELATVETLLKSGRDVVIDSVNDRLTQLKSWAKVAWKNDAKFRVVDVKTSLQESLRRNEMRRDSGGRFVSPSVIEEFAKGFQWKTVEALPPMTVEPFSSSETIHRDPAIIVDVDGTLAHRVPGGRSPYDYSRVMEDTVDSSIRDLVNKMSKHYKVLIVSGRKKECYLDTSLWLTHHGINWDLLLMRDGDYRDAHGNQLPDWVIKYNIFNESIADSYDVQFVLDDRDQVVKMWRKLGLKCLQVQPGDF